MKHSKTKTGILAVIAVLVATPWLAEAQEVNSQITDSVTQNLQTKRRPDVAFVISNNTNHAVTFRAETFCADALGTFVVPARQQRYVTWGEAMNHGTCALLAKDIMLTADGYKFLIDTFANFSNPVFKPTMNEKWQYDFKGDGKVTLDRSAYDDADLYIELSVRQ